MTLGVKDKRVLKAFIEKKPCVGYKLSTDGYQIDGHWMGGFRIAEWSGNGDGNTIRFNDLGSRAAQTVQRAVAKAVPASWLASYGRRK